METIEKPKIKKIKTREDLTSLIEGDIIEISGRNYPVEVDFNNQEFISVYGRGKGISIDYILFNHNQAKANEGYLKLNESQVNNLLEKEWERNLYKSLKNKLEESGIWEKE